MYWCAEGALAGLVQCLPPHLVPWMDPQYPGYTKVSLAADQCDGKPLSCWQLRLRR